MPAPFLSGQIVVEIAWGADLTALPSTWVWTDVTTDVRIAEGINLKHGRADEAGTSQPASCTLSLTNALGKYSLGGRSPNWPYVRQNTPVRVRVDPTNSDTWTTLFLGYADSWEPEWNQAATVPVVNLTASGVLRRLAQHTNPIQSLLRRRLLAESNVVAYWPMEDGSQATAAQAAPSGPPMTSFGEVNFGANTKSFVSTSQTAVLQVGGLTGEVAPYAGTGAQQVRCLMAFPPAGGSGIADLAVLLRVWMTSSSLARLDLTYGTGGSMRLNAFNSAGAQVASWGPVAFNVDGAAVRVFLEMKQNGSSVNLVFGRQSVAVGSGNPFPVSLSPATLGNVQRVDIAPDQNCRNLAVGQVVVQNQVTGIFDDFAELIAYRTEVGFARFRRLCKEAGVASFSIGDGVTNSAVGAVDQMGVQSAGAVIPLLREVEASNDAVMYDGTDESTGLVLRMRQSRENSTPVLQVPANWLAAPLAPTYDDQNRINRVEVSRPDGGTIAVEDKFGPLGTNTIGVYDTSETLNVASDAVLADHANWRLRKGLVDGYRFAAVDLDLSARPSLISGWLAARPGRRLQITSVRAVAPQINENALDLEIQGYQQTITPFAWKVSINCAPHEPMQVARLAADSGDADEFVARLDTDASVVATGASAGATSLSVTTLSGPIWTTTADDFPLVVVVGGIYVLVTAISGSTGTQTFTVHPSTVSKPLTAGLPVSVYRPAVLAL